MYNVITSPRTSSADELALRAHAKELGAVERPVSGIVSPFLMVVAAPGVSVLYLPIKDPGP